MDNGAVQAMARSGMGRAVMPYLAVEADDPGIDIVDLDPPIPERRIALARRAGRTLHPAADDFIRHAGDVCTERVAEQLAAARVVRSRTSAPRDRRGAGAHPSATGLRG